MWKNQADGFGKRRRASIGHGSGFLRTGFLMLGISVDEDGLYAQVMAELDVAQAIADDQAGFSGDLRVVRLGLLEETRQRFAAVALALVVGAKVETVDASAGLSQFGLELGVNMLNVSDRVEAQSDAALVGDDEDAQAGSIEACDGFRNAGEHFKMLPAGNVLPFRHFAV